MYKHLKRYVYDFIEPSAPGDIWGRIFDIFVVVVILANTTVVVLETVPDLNDAYGAWFSIIDRFAILLFTVLYLVRIWCTTASSFGDYEHPLWGRLRYLVSPLGVIDFLSIAPFYIGLAIAIPDGSMRVLRILRLLLIARYSPALGIIGAVLREQRRALGAALLVLLTMLIILSTLIYAIEREAQPQAFASIPSAMWWTMVTLTTVGYGDVVPATALGRVIGGITMITGILMVALPTGVVVTGFADEVRKRNFVVNWKLVSKVPLFVNLDAAQIAEVVSLLTPIVVPANQAVVRVGEDASSMYFVVSGRLEVQMHPNPVYLEAGDFFGEMGIIEARRRSASIIALSECNLLELKAEDFHQLLKNHDTIKASVDAVIETRKRQLVQIGDRETI